MDRVSIVSSVLGCLCLFAVVLRIYSRKLTKGLGWDDGLTIAAAMLAVTLYGLAIYCMLLKHPCP